MQDPVAGRIVDFLVNAGIPVRIALISEPTFLPGLTVQEGVLVIDEQQLLYPGDLLHEAGHLALFPPDERSRINGNMGDDLGLEIGAIAWSYAAAVHLGIDPSIVFHPAGYRGSSQAFLENFSAGRYVGVPVLEWLGLAAGEKSAKQLGVPGYPVMTRWLREA